MNSVQELFLNGMPVGEFFFYMLMAVSGAFLYLCARMYNAIKVDASTPFKFSWRYTIKGFIKLLATVLLLPLIITHFSEIVPVLLKYVLNVEIETVELTVTSAIITGFFIDYLVRRIFKIKSLNTVVNKIGKK